MYFLMSQRRAFIKRGEGGAQPNISKEKIVLTLIPLPPIEEQQRIVDKIEELFAKIDDYEKLELKLVQLKEKFDTNIKSLRTHLINCKEDCGVWGIKDAFWQWMFHELQCVYLGRLEYEPFYHFSDVSYNGINEGDRVILIHIPG